MVVVPAGSPPIGPSGADPDAAVFGGPVFPRYEPPVPQWILECETQLQGVFAYWDIGKEEKPLWDADKVYYVPCGPNFALRTAEQRGTRYDLKLGMAPGQKRRGEELQVLERIRISGASGYWVPDARVEHCARRDMQTIRYVSSYFRSSGETDAFLWGGSNKGNLVRRAALVVAAIDRRLVAVSDPRRISPAKVWVRHSACV